MLHVSQVHLHPQPFTMLVLIPVPAPQNVEENEMTLVQLILFLTSLVTSIGYHIKLLQTFVNNLLFSSWLRKQYNFLESRIFRWLM